MSALCASDCEAGASGHFFSLEFNVGYYFYVNGSTVISCCPSATGLGKCAFSVPYGAAPSFEDLNFTACFSSNGTAALHLVLYGDGSTITRLTVSGCLGRDVMNCWCKGNTALTVTYSNVYRNVVVRGSSPPNTVPWGTNKDPYQYGVLVSGDAGFPINHCVFLNNAFNEPQSGYVLHDVLPIVTGVGLTSSTTTAFLISDSCLNYSASVGATYFSVTNCVNPCPSRSVAFSASSRAEWTRFPQSRVPDNGSLTLVASLELTLSSSLRLSVECRVSSVHDGTEYLESGLGDRKSVALSKPGSVVRSCNLDGDRESAGLTASVDFVISSAFVSGYLIRSQELRATASPTWAFDSADRAKLSSGAITGIVLGILALLAVVVLIIYLKMKSASGASSLTESSSTGVMTRPGSNEFGTAEWREKLDKFMNSVECESPEE
jgi:hypothetical protein